jgi:hypothetical protein
MALFDSIATSVVGGLASAAVAYYLFGKQKLIELRSAYDQELRSRRLGAYQELWKAFEPLAQFSPEQDLRYRDVLAIAAAMRSWYFKQGGLVLTPRARDLYMVFHETVDRMAANARNHEDVLRRRDLRLSRAELRQRLEAMSFDLSPPPLGATAWKDWVQRLEIALDQRALGVDADQDFMVLQCLASRLRTLLAGEIRTREVSILEEPDAPGDRR